MNKNLVSYPPYIMMADPDSWAAHTLLNRFPPIVSNIKDLRPLGSREERALETLLREIPEGNIYNPFTEEIVAEFLPEELNDWEKAFAEWRGKRWIDLPFYFGEAYLYLRLLIAAGYYWKSSSFYHLDPFLLQKEEELSHIVHEPLWGRTLSRVGSIQDALWLSVKGNRVDLSLSNIAKKGRTQLHEEEEKREKELIINHYSSLEKKVEHATQIDIVLDNAGSELLCDLHFAKVVLSVGEAEKVVFHCKKYPFFVSDATVQDVFIMLFRLAQEKSFSSWSTQFLDWIQSGKIEIKTHYYWNGPHHFTTFPAELQNQFASSNVVIFKGDANYRRLVEDRAWPFSTPFEEVVKGFPTTLVSLRTLKSEVLLGISQEKANEMYAQDPEWLVNGKWGIAHLVEKV
ncbi:MAG: damage-control phosphatase ARMT1 family protein [Spirochaetales bacterium]